MLKLSCGRHFAKWIAQNEIDVLFINHKGD